MATTSETIYTHTCDLCGEVRDENDLRHLWNMDPALRTVSAYSGKAVKADICPGCQDRPVSEVFAFMAAKGSEPRSIVVRAAQP